MPKIHPTLDSAYLEFLTAFKDQVSRSRLAAARAIGRAHMALWWDLGRLIVDRQNELV